MLSILKRDHNLAYILILNLLYPAVLGSIFYSVFSNVGALKLGFIEITCASMMLSVLIFFAVDFLYTYLHEKYSAFHFISDCLLLLMMQGAFSSINFLAGKVNSRHYCLYMSVTFLIFLVWDYLQRHGLGKSFGKIIKLELALVLTFMLLAFKEGPGYFLPALVSMTGAFLMSKFFLNYYLFRCRGLKLVDNIPNPLTVLIEPTNASIAKATKESRLRTKRVCLGVISVITMVTLRKIVSEYRRP